MDIANALKQTFVMTAVQPVYNLAARLLCGFQRHWIYICSIVVASARSVHDGRKVNTMLMPAAWVSLLFSICVSMHDCLHSSMSTFNSDSYLGTDSNRHLEVKHAKLGLTEEYGQVQCTYSILY